MATTTRRPATAADLTAGATAYRGKGKVAYRIHHLNDDRTIAYANQATSKPGTRPTWFYVTELTVQG